VITLILPVPSTYCDRHQPGPGLSECWPGQPTAWQTCSWQNRRQKVFNRGAWRSEIW